MPALLPPPIPRFSSSITLASGNRLPTISSVSSVEPWSTTIVSWPRTLSRQRSIHSAELKVTTTTETFGGKSDIGSRQGSVSDAAEALPEKDPQSGWRERNRDEEEEEPGRERLVGVDAEIAQEADEERLADCEAVDRERHE